VKWARVCEVANGLNEFVAPGHSMLAGAAVTGNSISKSLATRSMAEPMVDPSQ